MPIYEYACESCGERFEVAQRFSDPPVESCRVCDGAVRKIIAPTAFVLKGSGWYKTDYASSTRTKAADTGKSDTEKSASKDAPSTTPNTNGKSKE